MLQEEFFSLLIIIAKTHCVIPDQLKYIHTDETEFVSKRTNDILMAQQYNGRTEIRQYNKAPVIHFIRNSITSFMVLSHCLKLEVIARLILPFSGAKR